MRRNHTKRLAAAAASRLLVTGRGYAQGRQAALVQPLLLPVPEWGSVAGALPSPVFLPGTNRRPGRGGESGQSGDQRKRRGQHTIDRAVERVRDFGPRR